MKILFAVFFALTAVNVVHGDIVILPGNVEVVVDPDGSKVARFAASDLANHMSKVLGCAVFLAGLH
jgi:hypothetical protein